MIAGVAELHTSWHKCGMVCAVPAGGRTGGVASWDRTEAPMTRSLPLALAAFALAVPGIAQACGGFFCNQAEPIDQAGEEILFAVDGDAGTTEMHVKVQYEGPASEKQKMSSGQRYPMPWTSSWMKRNPRRKKTPESCCSIHSSNRRLVG